MPRRKIDSPIRLIPFAPRRSLQAYVRTGIEYPPFPFVFGCFQYGRIRTKRTHTEGGKGGFQVGTHCRSCQLI